MNKENIIKSNQMGSYVLNLVEENGEYMIKIIGQRTHYISANVGYIKVWKTLKGAETAYNKEITSRQTFHA